MAEWVRTSMHAFDAVWEGLRGAYHGFWFGMRVRWNECQYPAQDLSIDALLRACRWEWDHLQRDLPPCPAASETSYDSTPASDPDWVPSTEDWESVSNPDDSDLT